MKIVIETVPSEKMRYSTAGDYFLDDDTWRIQIAEMSDARSEWLVLFHEIAELALVIQRGIRIDTIDRFDINYESNRQPGDSSEPGDQRNCPYREEHSIATSLERLLCEALRMKWSHHETVVEGALR